MTEKYPLRLEIEQILLAHPRTRYAKVLDGMTRSLTDAQMSQEANAAGQPCSPESIANVRKTVRLTLDDQLVAARSDAEGQAGLYRELLNYRRSPELQQRIVTRLTQLQQMDPDIRMTPLGDVNLGANNARRLEKPVQKCPHCNLEHAGECP